MVRVELKLVESLSNLAIEGLQIQMASREGELSPTPKGQDRPWGVPRVGNGPVRGRDLIRQWWLLGSYAQLLLWSPGRASPRLQKFQKNFATLRKNSGVVSTIEICVPMI